MAQAETPASSTPAPATNPTGHCSRNGYSPAISVGQNVPAIYRPYDTSPFASRAAKEIGGEVAAMPNRWCPAMVTHITAPLIAKKGSFSSHNFPQPVARELPCPVPDSALRTPHSALLPSGQ